MQRRQAAVLFADIAGYSRLIESQELETIAAVNGIYRDKIRPAIKAEGGRVVRRAGDGIMAEFPNSAAAVKAALDMHAAFAEVNRERESSKRIYLRIGINLCEVVPDGGDLFGHGVNLAARLEAMAPPGETLVTDAIWKNAAGKVDATFTELGWRSFKNMLRPEFILRVTPMAADANPAGQPTQQDGDSEFQSAEPMTASTTVPAIAVLPFRHLLGGADSANFSEGIVDDIVLELSRFRSIRVIARSSAFRASEEQQEYPQIGAALGCDYLITGNIRRKGEQLGLTVALIELPQGRQVWANRYETDLGSLGDIADDIVRIIVARVESELTREELHKTRRRSAQSLRAYDLWLEGSKLIEAWTAEADAQALRLFQRAISLDPNFARAYGAIASIHNSRNMLAPGDLDAAQHLAMGLDYARKAVSLDASDARNHIDLGWSYMLAREFSSGRRHFDLAGKLNPNDANICISRGLASAFLGSAQQGMELAEQACSLNPLHPDWYLGNMAIIAFLCGEYEETLELTHQCRTPFPESGAWAAAAAGCLGDHDQAEGWIAQFSNNVAQRWSGNAEPTQEELVAWLLDVNALRRSRDIYRLLSGLAAAGMALPGANSRVIEAMDYAKSVGEIEPATYTRPLL